jgi:hypothetical protein
MQGRRQDKQTWQRDRTTSCGDRREIAEALTESRDLAQTAMDGRDTVVVWLKRLVPGAVNGRPSASG